MDRARSGGTRTVLGGPSTFANPLLDMFEVAMASSADIVEMRTHSIARYAFAIPTDQALDRIRQCSPGGVVEIGAGAGYWAHSLHQRGVDVEAFDIEPAPSPRNAWFASTPPWYPVQRGDHNVVGGHPGRTLLIVWPTKSEVWAAAAVEHYFEAGGTCVVYVGEGPGGRTGDDVFHALLGELVTCAQCAYGSMTSPCICGVEPQWRRTEMIVLPHWTGYNDDLHIYTRRPPRPPSQRRWPKLRRSWSRWR
jgi:hypothetical protein